jgi:hypothetical protein
VDSTAELDAAFELMAGVYDYADNILAPNSIAALQLVHLQYSQSVLKLGAGSDRFLAAAKQQVG